MIFVSRFGLPTQKTIGSQFFIFPTGAFMVVRLRGASFWANSNVSVRIATPGIHGLFGSYISIIRFSEVLKGAFLVSIMSSSPENFPVSVR